MAGDVYENPEPRRLSGDLGGGESFSTEEPLDPWRHRSEGMRCRTCMYYVPKGESGIGRCRRHAPIVQQGWPVVFAGDWCGDHKLDEAKA